MVIGVMPIGEYDRRVVLLTRECGKISAFARSARKPNSPLIGATDLFCYGTFKVYAGRDAYTLVEASIQNYFAYFRTHIEEAMIGQYFMEVMDYCTRENNDEAMLLLLTYQSLRALESDRLPNRLVRSIFEIKTVVIEGEFEEPNEESYTPATMMAIRHIATSGIARLYSFVLDDQPMRELTQLADRYMNHCFAHHFKSLDVMDIMGL